MVVKGQNTYHMEGGSPCVRKFASPGNKWVLSLGISHHVSVAEQFGPILSLQRSLYTLSSNFVIFQNPCFVFDKELQK